MRFLAFDIGTRRTGVAFLDTSVGIPLPLDTLHHTSVDVLLPLIIALIDQRKAERIIIGLPLLPSGAHGSQSEVSKGVGTQLLARGLDVEYVDERYTTPRNSDHKHTIPTRNLDGDASAACALLSGKIDC